MLLFLGVLFLKLNHILSAAIPIPNSNKESKYVFPAHIDFQKVGEVTFNNEKYNVLRPSTHLVTDHFEDSLLRRDTSNFPTKRVLVDKNGFRHYWSSLENKRIMRKADIDENVIIETINNQESSNNDETVTTDVPTIDNNVATTDDPTTHNDELATSPQVDVKTIKDDEETTKVDKEATSDESTTQNDNNATTNTQSEVDNTADNAVDLTTDTTTRRRPKRSKRTERPTTTEGPEDKQGLRTSGGKKGYKTSFFCPFYGVITMTSVY